ncbi:MAG TPA: hypothetical protein VM103_01565 [Candidatus Paceibacterota bacterium]|nr:hypothetical protein [Candidatus Paceibacterota bacterium]
MTTSNREWKFCGRYGDKDEAVQIKKLPDELTDKLKQSLRLLYQGKTKECDSSDLYKLEEFGLVRQVGNAWSHGLVWAPQVHSWMAAVNKNDATVTELRARYV